MEIKNIILFMVNKRSVGYVILIALMLQVILISYNNFIGFIEINSPGEFIIRLLFGTFFASLIALYLFVLNVKMLNILNNKYHWKEHPWQRIMTEVIFVILIGISGGVIVTSSVQIVSPYRESFGWIVFINSTITLIVNTIMVVILEAIHFYRTNQETKLLSEQLEKENALIRLETLKGQLNPHFLFNSLNVLSSLVSKNPGRAQEFIDEIAAVYRYTLDVIDTTVINLGKEIEYAKSYLFLQKIRFENGVKTTIGIDPDKLDYLVPPLSVQTILENVFKHNVISEDDPVEINIYNEGDKLIVSNSYKPKNSSRFSKGVGLMNLKKRYEVICGEAPASELNNYKYIAELPLLKPD